MRSLLYFAFLFIAGTSFAQTPEIPKCLSHEYINYMDQQHPGFQNSVDDAFNTAKAYNSETKSAGPHTIPVVVHVVYNTATQNIPDSVIFDQINVLNKSYNRLNADTVNMRSVFDPIKGYAEINFMLAQIDPSGNPTTGITRTQTASTSFGSIAAVTGDFTDLEKVKSTVDGGHDPWDQSRYLNIWVCNMSVSIFGQEITALLGYATPPAGLPNWPPGSTNGMSDGVVIQYQAFGSNNPNPLDPGSGPVEVEGKTTVHEVGHYLGLRHIWGDGDCTAEDGIDDTPNADNQSNSDCDTTKNTCTDLIIGLDLPDMVENYMDYSAETCQNTFTAGQVSLMKGVLENQRYDLVHGNPAGVEMITESTASIFPNPTTGLVHISHKDMINSVSLYTLAGELLSSDAANKKEFNLDLTGLAEGVYLLSIKTESSEIIQRVVKH